ncbi:thiamine pyrophosphate-dependent enzyme [Gammaproteobacteria bacterium]|nr:thiamine pyrophosphate-dependent enzyme [Gammaproteobacteria bacterium]
MITSLSADDLRNFENRVAETFNSGKIRAPVHLYAGNEEKIIDIFSDIKSEDWILCSWRSHYQCLLKGVPMEEVFSEIVAGRSISLCFPKYRIFSSAIVGGGVAHWSWHSALSQAFRCSRSGALLSRRHDS